MITVMAILAMMTWDMVADENALADLVFFGLGFNDLPSDLMA
jgi:hypothetical protein